MNSASRDRLTHLYHGPAGEAWDRIERRQPASYWEQNFVLGRHHVRNLLLSWMGPPEKLHLLDAGCGRAEMAQALARLGSEIVAVDLLPRFPPKETSRFPGPSPSFVLGDFCEIFSARQPTTFDCILMQEVLEDYPLEERARVLTWLGETPTPRVYLVFRIKGSADRWLKNFLPEGLCETIDPVALLRWIHLNTPLRLARQQKLHLRNYRVQVAELTRAACTRGTRGALLRK